MLRLGVDSESKRIAREIATLDPEFKWTESALAEKLMIAKVVRLDRSVISRNVQNTKISDMHNLLSQGHDMDYIAVVGNSSIISISCALVAELLHHWLFL